MDTDIVAALRSPQGVSLLAGLPPYDPTQVLTVAAQLRRAGHDPALVAAALTQSRLRSRAAAKLGDLAATMLFTPDGLEQATRGPVAVLHARRFVEAGVQHVWDLGCGIGSDALAFCAAGLSVTAVDLDPVTVQVARANLADHPGARVCRVRAEDVQLPAVQAPGDGCWVDPARRIPGVADRAGRTRRVSGLGRLSPSWDFVRTLHRRVGSVGAKLAPGFARSDVPEGVEAQWLSYGGQALECSLWWGDLVQRAGAGVVVHDGRAWHTIPPCPSDPGGHEASLGTTIGAYLYDPDRAVLAAGRLDAVCAAVQGQELWSGSGYVSAESAVDTPFARCLQVHEVLPQRSKVLRAWARRHDIGALTLKKHAGSPDPDALRAQIRPTGSQQATLVLTRERHGSGSRAVAVWVSAAAPTRAG